MTKLIIVETAVYDLMRFYSVFTVFSRYRDRGGGGAGRAIALPLFCRDLFSRAPIDMGKVLVELLDFSDPKRWTVRASCLDEFLRTRQFLWKSGMFACPND